MDNFLLSGILFLSYCLISFHNKRQLLPSTIFTAMWGIACVFISLISTGSWSTIDLYEYYSFRWMNSYIVYFALVSIIGFSAANLLYVGKGIKTDLKETYLEAIVFKYKKIMYVNFLLGIARIIIFLSIFGWESMGDYRINAEQTLQDGLTGFFGLIFRISNYILLLANFYVAIVGLKHGLYGINYKEMAFTLVCFVPVLMSTGGRLWILYIILYYFGSYLIGACISKRRSLIPKRERKTLTMLIVSLIVSISAIGVMRQGGNMSNGKSYDKFSYITEGIVCAEYCMDYYSGDKYDNNLTSLGTFFNTIPKQYFQYRRYLTQNTQMSSIINCIIVFLYLDFGFYNSIVIWFFISFWGEVLALHCLRKLTIMRFLALVVIIKIFYESIFANSIGENIPIIELLLIFYIFRNQLFNQNLKNYFSKKLNRRAKFIKL